MHTDNVFETINFPPKLKMPKFPKDIYHRHFKVKDRAHTVHQCNKISIRYILSITMEQVLAAPITFNDFYYVKEIALVKIK